MLTLKLAKMTEKYFLLKSRKSFFSKGKTLTFKNRLGNVEKFEKLLVLSRQKALLNIGWVVY